MPWQRARRCAILLLFQRRREFNRPLFRVNLRSSFPFLFAVACFCAVAACKHRARYQVGDHLIPMGSSDPSQIVTVVAVDPDAYKVSTAPNPKPSDPVQTRTRREMESDYVRIDLPVGGSWLTEEDRAAALARARKPSATPTAALSATPTPTALVAQSTPTPNAPGTIDVAALAPAIRPAVALISTFDPKGKILRNTSGFFISNDGLFATTADAIAGAASGIVTVQSGAIYNVAGVLASSSSSGLVLLKVESGTVPSLTLSHSLHLQPGMPVLIADTVLRHRKEAVIPAIFAGTHTDRGGEAFLLTGNNLQASAGSAVLDAQSQVVGCVIRDETGPQVRSVRTVAALNALVAQASSAGKPVWPVVQHIPTPTLTPLPASEATLVYAPLPRYPFSARFGVSVPPSGTGRYLIKFGADGRASSVSVVQSARSSALDNAALEALRTWRVRPGAPSQRIVPITFRP